MKYKKIIIFVIAIVTVVSSLSITSFAADSNYEFSTGVFYEITGDCDPFGGGYNLIFGTPERGLTAHFRIYEKATGNFIDGYYADFIVNDNDTLTFNGCRTIAALYSSDFKGYDFTPTIHYSLLSNYLFVWYGDVSSPFSDGALDDLLMYLTPTDITEYDVGYNNGYRDGHTSGFEEGKNVGFESGYSDGYKAAEDLFNPPSIVGHYYGATIKFYDSNRPFESCLIHSTIIDSDVYSNIFNFADLTPIINQFCDGAVSEMYIEVVFPNYVDFLSNPLSFYNYSVDKSYYRSITDFFDIYIGSPFDDGFSNATYLCRLGDFDFYYPSGGYEHNSIGFYIKDVPGLLKHLNLTDDDDGLINTIRLSNKRFQTFRLDAEYIDQIKAEAYQSGVDNADTSAFIDGREYGFNEGYKAALEIKGGSFIELFDGIANTPITVLRSVLGFEIFGMNVLGTLLGLLTIGIVIFIIRKFI